MFWTGAFYLSGERKELQVIGRNPKSVYFFDLKVALFWT